MSVEAFDLDKRILTVDLALVDGAYKTPKTKGSLRKIELTEQGIIAARILIAQASHRRPRSITVTQTDNRTKKIISRTLVAYNRPGKHFFSRIVTWWVSNTVDHLSCATPTRANCCLLA